MTDWFGFVVLMILFYEVPEMKVFSSLQTVMCKLSAN